MWQQDYVYPGAMAYKSYGDLVGSAIRGAGDNIKRDKDTALASALKQQEGMNKLEWEAQKLYSELEPDYMFKNLRQETYEVPQVILDRRTNREKYEMDQAELAQKTANDAAELALAKKESDRNYSLGRKAQALQGQGMKQWQLKEQQELAKYSNPASVNQFLSQSGLPDDQVRAIMTAAGFGPKYNRLFGNTKISPEQAQVFRNHLEGVSRLRPPKGGEAGYGTGGFQLDLGTPDNSGSLWDKVFGKKKP